MSLSLQGNNIETTSNYNICLINPKWNFGDLLLNIDGFLQAFPEDFGGIKEYCSWVYYNKILIALEYMYKLVSWYFQKDYLKLVSEIYYNSI